MQWLFDFWFGAGLLEAFDWTTVYKAAYIDAPAAHSIRAHGSAAAQGRLGGLLAIWPHEQ